MWLFVFKVIFLGSRLASTNSISSGLYLLARPLDVTDQGQMPFSNYNSATSFDKIECSRQKYTPCDEKENYICFYYSDTTCTGKHREREIEHFESNPFYQGRTKTPWRTLHDTKISDKIEEHRAKILALATKKYRKETDATTILVNKIQTR